MFATARFWLGAATLVAMLAALALIFTWVPTEADQGIVQRIFYFHVPAAWISFAAFALVAISGAFYLWLGDQAWDDVSYSAAETGMLFCTLVLVTGSLWAKPIWGAWWTWDSRLTTTLILWLLYGGYLMLRAIADDTPQVARFAAVVGIIAALDIPVIIVSVRLWRTIHPAVLVTREGGRGLEDPRMLATLFAALFALALLFAWLLALRLASLRARSRIADLRQSIALAEAAAEAR
jgi:heme exporter protein C